ncbi:protein transport protein Sec16A-like [Uloborus diversus]|uniref:protein transport protein Sec16A-like n=1 Tax=Uloborus diversus TaxID=327109 RepID=UPI0024097A78|nr:protein transport protein Sec16A-like [Uloborus diversus]
MSKRLLQRGRYPKGTGVENVTTTNSQFPPATSGFPPPAAEVPFYGPPLPSQPPQNAWNTPLYSVPNTYHQNQIPNQSVPESSNHWSPGQMYSMPAQPSTTSQWNWKPESTEPTPYPNYQAPPQPIEDWPQIPCSVIDNQNYSQQQPMNYPQAQPGYPSDFQTANNNSNSIPQNPPLQAWENGGMSMTQAEQLPWTYSTPQYTNSPQPDFPQNFNPVSTTNPPSWNYNPEQVVQPEVNVHGGPVNYLPNSSPTQDINKQLGDLNLIEQNTSTDQNEKISSVSLSAVSSTIPNDNTSGNVESASDAEYGTSTLSAFFQNNDPENSANNSECDGPLMSENENVVDSKHVEEVEEHHLVTESDQVSVHSEVAEPDEEIDDENQGNDFIQEEDLDVPSEDLASKSNSISPSGFVEEPINQEVPEPHVDESVNVKVNTHQVQQSLEEQDNLEVSPEEPLNQQIPPETGQKSRSTSSERERIVIRPREDSPFKPPRINSNSKGTVVQQEVTVQNIPETKTPEPEKKTVAQVVNLETFPDNLERPPDYEELRKQSPLYVSHQKHLRKELNSSPSSLLCDNPDIPCVTFAPAAPPIHSSAKSDKSESSCDSKQETHSLDNPASLSAFMNGSKIKSSSPFNEEEHYEKLKTVSQSASSAPLQNVAKQPKNSDKKNKNNFPTNSKQENLHHQQNNPSQPVGQGPLKDSKVNGSHVPNRPPELLRRQPEHPETPSSSYSGSSRQDIDIVRAQGDPRGNPGGMDARQRFADYKYPSYDERHYYSDRERSRPASRSSLGERPEDYMYQGKREDYMYPPGGERHRGPPEYPRPSSRTSESDMNRHDRSQYDYYQRQQYPYGDPYQRQPDYYPRPQNYRGYNYDPYQRDPYYAQYYDAYRYAYSNYNYGFYDEMIRNDPRYKQYQEQYRQYYAKYGYDADYERSSLQSGRSSANELVKDVTPSQYVEPDLDSNESEFSTYNLRQDYSYSSVPNESSILAIDQSSTSSARLTPVKFSYAHPIAHFTPNGLLLTAIPSQATLAAPSAIRIQNLQMFMEEEESYQELKNYQGPLIRGSTHKNDVIEFCSQKIKSLKSKDVVDRDSHILLWELMVLLLRQNGSVAGSDIAELLLKDHEVLRPISVPLKQAIETPQGDNSPADVNDSSSQSHAGDASSPDEGIVVLHDKNILNTSRSVDVDKITRKFREFLLYGHKKDALEWAMKHGLWGHALFLASKMDLRTYASVMTRFANSLALNDPLQTLYQLMSGRQPSAVTFVADKKWGDWRPHLAMILSNPSSHPDVDSRSITTLGDTLASRGCLPAAHFCYIMAQVEFGTFEQKSSKLVLLSSDHRLPFEEFATNEAIQFTEIYEYAQSLANPGYMLSHLQMYKFLYALRLIEHGLLEEGLHYLEVISENFHAHPSLFPLDFITEVLKLGTQLKYHDPYFMRGQGELEDQEDPEWLRNLTVLVQNYNNIIQGLDFQQSELQQNESSQSYSNEQLQSQTPVDNVSYQNVSGQSVQNEMSGSVNHINYYQQNSWNQQPPSAMQTNGNCPPNQQETMNYYQNEMGFHGGQSNFQMESSIPSHEENETTDVPSSPVTQTPPFDYYSGGTQQAQDSRQSSFDYGSNYGSNTTRRERRDSAMSSASRYSAGSLSVANKSVPKEVKKAEVKKESKQNAQVGKTWLGGIFSRLLPKGPNQMILPDDKNPTIVWDDTRNCWVNKDSNDDDETSAPLAPPTDMELMGSKSSDKPMMPQGSSMLPGNSVPPGNSMHSTNSMPPGNPMHSANSMPPGNSMPSVSTSTVNKFQRPKTRIMRQNYVDVLNTSGSTTKSNVPPEALFPSPFENTGTPKMFIPNAAPVNEESASEFESGQGSISTSHQEPQEPTQAPPISSFNVRSC